MTRTKIIRLKEQKKIVIAGAGPAGLAASLQLARNKIEHILLEKGDFPKDKICGDALSGKVMDAMKKLDPEIAGRFYAQENSAVGSYGVRFIAPGGRSLDVPFKKDLSKLSNAPGFISKRVHFDQFLFDQLDHTYCDFRPNAVLKSIRRENGKLVMECDRRTSSDELHCNLVIGADGDRSVVARQLGKKKMDARHYCAGLRCYYHNVS